jgi:hypothetical protein
MLCNKIGTQEWIYDNWINGNISDVKKELKNNGPLACRVAELILHLNGEEEFHRFVNCLNR